MENSYTLKQNGLIVLYARSRYVPVVTVSRHTLGCLADNLEKFRLHRLKSKITLLKKRLKEFRNVHNVVT